MSKEYQNQPLKSFAPRYLPWLLGLVMLIVYLFTLNPWVNLLNLGQVARVSGWVWQPQLNSPLTYLVTYPFRWLPAAQIPLALNIFAALCAATVLALLARIIALLPHDRTDLERTRERSDFAFLTGWVAWLPPTLAVLIGGLQMTLWLHATNFTGEMFDLLLFVGILWQLMEYRLDERESRLFVAAAVYGAGLAEDWAFIGFFPIFLTAIIWLRKLDFFNLRFLWRMVLLGLVGLSSLLLLPLLAKMNGQIPLTLWESLKPNLQMDWSVLKAIQQEPVRHNLALMSLTTLLPVLVFSIRWSASFGDRSHLGSMLTRYLFHFVHTVIFAACLWIMFDPPFSPRLLGMGVPALTLYAMAILSIGYYAGYFLLVFGVAAKTSRRQSHPAPALPDALQWLCPVIVVTTLFFSTAAIALLLYKNGPAIHSTNDDTLLKYARFVSQNLPSDGGILLCDSDSTAQIQASRAFLIQAMLTRENRAKNFLVVDTQSLNWAPYHRFLNAQNPAKWPLIVNVTNTGSVNPVGILSMLSLLSRSNNLCYLNPSYGYYFEQFYQEPHGLVYRLKTLPEDILLPPPLDQSLTAENESFWNKVSESALPAIETALTLTPSGDLKKIGNQILDNLHVPAEPNLNAVYAGTLYSRALNAWGVQLQRANALDLAFARFSLALKFNPDNVAATINLDFNRTLRSGVAKSVNLGQVSPERFGKYRDWNAVLNACGPFDETSFCFEDGLLLASQNSLFRQSVSPFSRVRQLAPENLPTRLWLAQLFLFNRLPDRALEALQEPLANPARFSLNKSNSTEIHVLASAVYFQKNDSARGAEYLEQEIAQHPDDDTLLTASAQAFLMRGLYTNALRVVERKLARTPDDPQWLFGKGYASLQLARYDQAIATLSRLLEIQANDPTALFNRAFAYLQSDRLDQARADYAQLQSTYTNSFQIAYGLGEIARRQHRTNEAVRHFKIYLANAPTNAAELPSVRERLAEWGNR